MIEWLQKGGGKMEIVLEYFISFWYELALKFVPESKKTSVKVLFVCKFIATVLLLYQVTAFIAGAIIMANITGMEILGFILFSSSNIIFVLQIVLGIVFCNKKK